MTTLFSGIRVAAVVAAAIFTSGFTSPSTSKPVDKIKTDLPAITVQLKYVGANNEYSIFELAFCNAQETRFTVKIMDENDTIFLTDYVKGVSFVKKYLLNNGRPL